jgi:hypothetical protein
MLRVDGTMKKEEGRKGWSRDVGEYEIKVRTYLYLPTKVRRYIEI